eukprot:CAMPEP_0196767862 /NCGR_PEP_ID=MMETSP1095-20130614/42048_1 /TAXON_ID=96789 ORGANISM="Chromulina nebulosa, Strain UTEXLB2642" /NCGR_SAMPLE_ID=MMETSP1095 /ASSEMBLY_ACC=CAM_ASM_000446 /LENGTH=290 /DNA_ID=CAMNT_0042136617 /DNA_START=861 /DNA_END=1734 /DNA_ORIENTATION=-
MPLEVMFDHIVTLLSAGHDTTAFYASYLCYLLGQYPTTQDKIVEEINNVVGDREYITADDVSEMKYLQKAMQECLRMYAIIPNVSRVAASEVHIKEVNVTIPKGATVLIPMFLINRDPDIWENPSEFNPDDLKVKDITADDVSEMKYLQKAMQECLRMYAIIPNVSRVAISEVHIKEADVTIPKGATVMIPMFLINRDPDIWENPSEFNPERFEGKGSEYFTNAKSGFFPFGYGSRTCIGNILAQLESAIFITQILRRFRIEADPGFKPNIMAGISLTTSNGINVVLRHK